MSENTVLVHRFISLPATSDLLDPLAETWQKKDGFTEKDEDGEEHRQHEGGGRVPNKLADICPFIPGKHQGVRRAQEQCHVAHLALYELVLSP